MPLFTFAQGEGCTGASFVQTLRDDAGEDVRATSVIAYPGGGNDLLVGGTVGGNIFLSRISRQGDLRWRRVITTPSISTELSTLGELVIDEEGMIAGVGSSFAAGNIQRLYVFRYNPQADQVLYFREPPFPSEGTGIKLGAVGEYLISGSKNGEPSPIFNSAYVARISRSTGEVINQGITFDYRGDEGLLDLYRLPNGTVFAGGNVAASGGAGDTRASLTRLDSEGNQLWTRIGYAADDVNARLLTFDVEVVNNMVYVLSWGSVGVVTGSINTAMILSTFDLNGTPLWTRRYDIAQFSGEEAVELVPHNGGLLAYGFNLIGRRTPFLIQLDLSGNVNWARTYDLPGSVTLYLRCNQQLLADDSGIVALANYSFPGDRAREGALLTLDVDGQSDNACISISDTEVIITNLGANWAEIDLEPSPQGGSWAAVASGPTFSTLAAFDDCDAPCDNCTTRSFSSTAICAGNSIFLGGATRTEPGVYADTLSGSVPGCDSIQLTELLVSSGPQVSFIIDRSCGFATADVQLIVSQGIFPYQYTWSAPMVTGARVNLPTGNYQVTVNDALGCNPAIIEITIDSVAPGALDFRTAPPFCPGENTGVIQLEPPGSGSLRLLPDGEFLADRIDSLPPGDYGVIFKDSTGCEAFRQIYIDEPRPAQINIDAPAFVRLGDQITLSADPLFGSLFTNYQWCANDSVRCANCPTATIQPLASGQLALQAMTLRGCPVSDSVFLQVISGPARIFLPTGFSPNNDNLNDNWEPGLGPEVDHVVNWQVYDRWGGLSWEYKGDENWWTGEGQAVGLYTYTFSAVLIDGRVVEKSGEVTLIR